METNTPNLSTDFVKDMLAESPAKEPKAVVADRIPKLPKNVHWTVMAVVEPHPCDSQEVKMRIPYHKTCSIEVIYYSIKNQQS